MKYSQLIGIAAAILLIIAGFLPWTFHPDLNKYFTGFFSEDSVYGRPGKVFIVLAAVAIAFFAIDKLWAKRANLAVCAIAMAFGVKTFIVFSGCYRGICPDKQFGLYLMLGSALLMLVMSFLPTTKTKNITPE